jgi:hypothetical protein
MRACMAALAAAGTDRFEAAGRARGAGAFLALGALVGLTCPLRLIGDAAAYDIAELVATVSLIEPRPCGP